MVIGKRELSVVLLVFGAVISVYMALLANPTSAQNGGGGTTGGTTNGQDSCAEDEELVETFSGTQDQTTPQFQITGDEWRFVLEATATTQTSGNVSVNTVFDPDNPGFGSAFASVDPDFDPTETNSSNIIDGPGTFSLEIDANGAEYAIFVCESVNQNPTTLQPTTPQQSQNEPTIINIPNKPLPPTGGLPVYGMVAGSIIAGAGLLGLGMGIRRGQRR